MFINVNSRLLYGIVIPSSLVLIGTLVWFRRRRSKEIQRTNSRDFLAIEIEVPDYCVGGIIGKQGENIKRLQREYSVRCVFVGDENRSNLNGNYRRLLIRGQRELVYQAEIELRRMIADLPRYEQIELFVPESACGFLIGRNGSSIREIRDCSKARLNFEKKLIDHCGNQRLTRLTISGTTEQIATAKAFIDERLKQFEEKLR